MRLRPWAALAALWLCLGSRAVAAAFSPDPAWPQPLPAGWVLGEVSGIAVDAQGNVWVLHRPPARGGAPPVIEYDPQGRVTRAWGGKGTGYDWFDDPHSLTVDMPGFVWLTGNGTHDDQVLEFTTDGHFVRQIGHPATGAASNDTTRLSRPAGIAFDPAAQEIYVADGYANRRIIVFDARTGAYQRLWGAYGLRPDDAPHASRQFGHPVHCVHISSDGLIYVCDRQNDRVQIFHKDGSFVAEWRVAPATRGMGSVWDLAFSPTDHETTLLVADGSNEQLHVLRRSDGAARGEFGTPGSSPGQFRWLHAIAFDSQGRLFTSEVKGRRLQRWLPDSLR